MHLCFRDVRRSEGCRTVHDPKCTLQAAFLVSATFAGRTLLGRTESSASSPVKRLLPYAAVPAAVAGLAAAFTIGNTSSAPVADEMTGHSATTSTATTDLKSPVIAASETPLVSITHPAGTGVPVVRLDAAKIAAIQTKGKHHRTQSAKYTVKPGDTLASIAQHLYASADYWPVLYWANHAAIPDPSQITAGQVLTVPNKPAKIPSAPKDPAPAAPAATTASPGQGYSSASSAAAPATTATTSSSSYSSFQACVIARESGGNPQVMNGSGHYGLYQFSAGTWAAYGGNPADFGHASVAEQNQVFANAMAAGGASNWAPYDGC
jgi:LysM repeat protein